MTTAPTLTTERLRLRMPRLADFEPRAAFYASDRSIYEDGPLSRDTAWRIFASEVAQWPLMGYGPFSVEDRRSGAYLGEVGIYHPAHFPAPELGWFVVPEAEGQGIAFEAACAVIQWTRESLGLSRVVHYIDRGNARSIALAKRLGAVEDDTLPRPEGDTCLVLRNDLTVEAVA